MMQSWMHLKCSMRNVREHQMSIWFVRVFLCVPNLSTLVPDEAPGENHIGPLLHE